MMNAMLKLLEEQVKNFGTGPTLEEMARKTLRDKKMDGASAGHFIEEIHTPLNYAYLTCTTGTSALQNVVAVTHSEMPERTAAGLRVLERLGLHKGSRFLITYPPLAGVFGEEVFRRYGVEILFMLRPGRDALLLSLLKDQPDAVVGESSFLRAALQDAEKLGFLAELPEGLIIAAAGTPMDPDLRGAAAKLKRSEVHDLYGCQEFGWLCLDGIPVREDIVLWEGGAPDGYVQIVAGGLATGDCFLTKTGKNGERVICTESRQRSEEEAETTILESTAKNPLTVRRAARSILRIKAKIVRVSAKLSCGAEVTRAVLRQPGREGKLVLSGPLETKLLDDLIEAQKSYQRESKVDPVWNKRHHMTT